ncbi:MAG: hypothetical protein ACRDYA_17675 [Egibacteraceae bacterium]
MGTWTIVGCLAAVDVAVKLCVAGLLWRRPGVAVAAPRRRRPRSRSRHDQALAGGLPSRSPPHPSSRDGSASPVAVTPFGGRVEGWRVSRGPLPVDGLIVAYPAHRVPSACLHPEGWPCFAECGQEHGTRSPS